MGSLAHFAPWLHNGLRRYGFASFVETGTARGDSLAIAARLPFKALHSIEIVPDLAAAARVRFKDDARVQVWEGDSLDCLPMILRELPPEPCLFWLDAHFPGAHTGADYAAEPSVERRLPLGREVELIRQARPGAGDVLLIDDARIYQPGPYGHGDLPSDWPPLQGVERSLRFLREAYDETHAMVIDYAQEGYLMVCPRMRKAA